MRGIMIKTIGEVSLASKVGLTSRYRYDIPLDQLGFPYLPLWEILSGLKFPVADARVGFAHPEGYLGLIREAGELEKQFPNDREFICTLYTNERFYPEKGYHVRSLKSGQKFFAPIYCRDEDTETLRRFFGSIRQIGVALEDITGEAVLSLCTIDNEYGNALPMHPNCRYCSLEYSLQLLTPASVYAPYDDDKTYLYIPGSRLRKALSEYQERSDFTESLCGMTFSNAYISDEQQRLLPVPMSMAVVKLDKEQLRCRLSTGKDPSRAEQDLMLSWAFTDHFHRHFMRYTKPETERIASSDGMVYDALSPGQSFRGLIYGNDAEIRRLAEYIRTNPRVSIGELANEGFGEAYIKVCGVQEEEIGTEQYASCFDVVCLSHTVLLDEEGMPSVRAADFLREIERLLDAEGRLEIFRAYTDVYRDFDYHYRWEQDGPVIRCLKIGSVMRVKTKDGKGVDIFPILHTFIGENTKDGYGEIMAVPARNRYYRTAEYTAPDKYRLEMPVSYLNLHLGARLTQAALSEKLKKRVRGLASVDREEYAAGVPVDALMPKEMLTLMKDTYDSDLDIRIVEQWYREGLEEEDHA